MTHCAVWIGSKSTAVQIKSRIFRYEMSYFKKQFIVMLAGYVTHHQNGQPFALDLNF